MTGIGFLGAGVIFKEGLSVRGLTTAASIWITSAIGILVGVGFWVPAAIGTVATLTVLGVFRLIESKLPSEFYAHHHLRFRRDAVMAEDRFASWSEHTAFPSPTCIRGWSKKANTSSTAW